MVASMLSRPSTRAW